MENIVEKCKGCEYCTSYTFMGAPLASMPGKCSKYADPKAPEGAWRRGSCPYATHLGIVTKVVDRVRVGQQKQKKGKK